MEKISWIDRVRNGRSVMLGQEVEILHTWCENLIPRIVAACRWGAVLGKFVHSSSFGCVPTCVYMSHRPNESFVPEQQRK